MIEFPSAAADRAVLAALEEDAAACDLTTQWSVPDGLVSEATSTELSATPVSASVDLLGVKVS